MAHRLVHPFTLRIFKALDNAHTAPEKCRKLNYSGADDIGVELVFLLVMESTNTMLLSTSPGLGIRYGLPPQRPMMLHPQGLCYHPLALRLGLFQTIQGVPQT
eukprot:5049740-Amphidinium_carterae.2